MERGFYNEDFEQLIKQKADQYKMYPSDNVWKGIHRSLHTRRKWYWLGFLLFLAGVGYYMMVELMTPGAKKTADKLNPAPLPSITANTQKTEKAIIVPFSTPTRSSSSVSHPSTASYGPSLLNPEGAYHPGNVLLASEPALDIAHNDAGSVISKETPVSEQTSSLKKIVPLTTLGKHLTAIATGNDRYPLLNNIIETDNDATDDGATGKTALPGSASQAVLLKKELANDGSAEDMKRINWLQENAIYNLTPPPMRRVSWMLAFSPTMNYRKLMANSYGYVSVKNVPVAMNTEIDPDKLVNHKPALGFEIGTHILYALNSNIRIRAGLQFNYSRYDIQAYTTSTPDQATIALDYVGRHGRNERTSLTNVRNIGGDDVENLRNQYFQLSSPVGLELRLLGNEKLQLNIAGTIQPTYLLNRNTYLITTDYKNYTHDPSLVRRWNVNTGAELFISYKTGDLRWHVGPQFRYQLFSSYVKEYPIREYLMEYGIKIGVAKTIR